MSKIIWRDVDSSTIKGLLICELPPITKPKMRVQETEVDGVDGSIIEELGYESYDKSIKIGLTRDYDIDEVIKYFTGEGKLVLSNEPNKYYKAKIIEQIDYTKLLRFKEAEVKFRVQPFKYEYGEEEQIAATGSVEGTEVKITDAKATEIKIDGRSTQETRSGKNLFDASKITNESIVVSDNGKTITMPIVTSGNGHTQTGNTLSQLCPNLQVGDEVYLYFNRNLGLKYNNMIYLSEANVSWYQETKKTITQTMLDSKLGLYSNRYINGETEQCILTDFRIVRNANDEWEQYGVSPSPDFPSEIESVGYENLFDKSNITTKKYLTTEGIENTSLTSSISGYCKVKENYNYIINYGYIASNYYKVVCFYDKNKTFLNSYTITNTQELTSITTPNNCKYLRFHFITDNLDEVQLEEGSIVHSCIPYGKYGIELKITNGTDTNTSLFVLKEPLRSLPSGVKDIAYIRNNKLYVDRYVGSVVFNGSEEWSTEGTITNTTRYRIPSSYIPNTLGLSYTNHSISNYFKFLVNYNEDTPHYYIGYAYIYFFMPKTLVSTLDEFKTWLSENNTQVDYELATPVTEEYGDLTILELVDGENNISNSEEANMVIDYIETLIINNLGNYVSKPTFEIEGAGTIRFVLNGNLVFSYNFDADGRVVIDSEKEDAYLDAVLKNRNMNGDFPKLEIGENKITWDGIVKNMKITNKSRWL